MDYGNPTLADRLGSEYVAGTLRGGARRRFEALLPAHVGLRAAVTAWQDRLLPLTVVLPPLPPPPSLWKRIEAQLHGDGSMKQVAERTGWWAQLGFWRGFSALAGSAALGFAVLLASPGPTQAPIIVVLSAAAPASGAATTPASFVASVSADGRALVTRPLVNVALAADHALELWSLPASGAPRSLGVISPSGATVVKRRNVLDGTAALAVSLEPPGGAPHGAPTGPVLYVGKLGS